MIPTKEILESLLRQAAAAYSTADDWLREQEMTDLLRWAAKPVWRIPVELGAKFGLEFDVAPTAMTSASHGLISNIAMSLVDAEHPRRLVPGPGALCLLGQARTLGCTTSIELDFELAGEPMPRTGDWRRPPEGDEHTRHRTLNCRMQVVATDGQRALVLWRGGRDTMLVELANLDVVRPSKARAEGTEAPSKATGQRESAHTKALSLEFL